MSYLLIISSFLAIVQLAASAQTGHSPQPAHPKVVADSGKVYTYVEQMPELPGGGGTGAIALEVMKRIRYPALNPTEQIRYSGIIYTFVVGPNGAILHPAMVVSSNNQAVDRAILAAVRSLPRFQSGRQNGQPVSVRFTLSISCIKVQ